MFSLIMFLIFGIVVGLIAKAIHSGPDPVGLVPTAIIGILGSYIGGGLNWLLGTGEMFAPAGFLMSIVGAVLFCWAYSKYKLDQYIKLQNADKE